MGKAADETPVKAFTSVWVCCTTRDHLRVKAGVIGAGKIVYIKAESERRASAAESCNRGDGGAWRIVRSEKASPRVAALL